MGGSEVFLSLGSNFPDAANMLDKALAGIKKLSGVELAATSGVYVTEPQDYIDQPWFHNQVARLWVDDIWTAPRLLADLLRLERDLGRDRGPGAIPSGPRSIDIDMLLYGAEVRNEENCRLPHPRMCQRAFVLAPLVEIAPELRVFDKPLFFWLDQLNWKKNGNLIFQKN